jgi:hypothetical protein
MQRLFLLVLLFLGVARASGAIEISIPVVTGKHGDTLTIPVVTTTIPDSTILACQFTLGYSPNVITVIDIVTASSMVDRPGWSVASNITGDSVVVGAYGSEFLQGAGTVVKVRCLVNGTVGSLSSLVLRQFTYNAGSPVVTTKNGGISVVTSTGPAAPALPTVAALDQNFPNPFNPTTMIPYVLGRAAHVRLSVLSPLGQEMRVLVDQEQEAGEHRTSFDAAGMASGVYFYRLRTGEYTETRRMIVLR